MKRILTLGVFFFAVTVFFTGCNSLFGSLKADMGEIGAAAESEVISTTEAAGEAKISWNEEDSKKEPDDFFQKNMTEKFQDLEGERAFQIADGHSEAVEDFFVAGMEGEDTFIYGYTTKTEGGTSGEMVHCGAWYNYESSRLLVFHENRFQREEEADGPEDEESFSIQLCTLEDGSLGNIFVYDNGQGYLYLPDGTLRFQADLETFIREQYRDVFSVSVAHVAVDASERIYLELAVELEEVESPDTAEERDPEEILAEAEYVEDSEETDEEIRELDEEIAGKVKSVVMAYEVQTIAGDIYQKNEAFASQRQAWIDMAEGKEFLEEEKPDSGGDWTRAKEQIPDKWGDTLVIHLQAMEEYEGEPVYQWKSEPVFQKAEDVVLMVPEADTYSVAVAWNENQRLDQHFLFKDGRYSRLYGEIGAFRYDEGEEFSRRFQLIYYTTETGSDGSETEVKHTKSVTQSTRRMTRCRKSQLKNAYVESYWTLDGKKAEGLVDGPGAEQYCVGQDGTVYLISPANGNELSKTGLTLTEDEQAGIFRDGKQMYFLAYDTERMRVIPNREGENAFSSFSISYDALAGNYKAGEGEYEEQFQELNKDYLPGGFDGYGSTAFSGDQMLYAALSVDPQVVRELQGYEEEAGEIWSGLGSGAKGLLITMPNQSLVFYDVQEEKSLVIAEGSWYRTWRKGNHYLSVGFPGGASYEEKDMVFARVYEYDLNTLCSQSMKELLEERKTKEQKAQVKQMEEDAARASREAAGEEETENLMDRWERERRDERPSIRDLMDRWEQERREKEKEGEGEGEGGEENE